MQKADRLFTQKCCHDREEEAGCTTADNAQLPAANGIGAYGNAQLYSANNFQVDTHFLPERESANKFTVRIYQQGQNLLDQTAEV